MQLSDLQTNVYQQTGIDSTVTQNVTNTNYWINIAYQDIVSRWPWPFLRSEEFITTVTDYTTGTVSVSAGGTTVTGVGTTFTSAMADGTYKIQFAGALDWYTISAYSSATSITIGTAYAQTTALSAGTYTIRRMYYPLSSTCDRIQTIKNNNTPLKMFETDIRTLDSVSPDLEAVNNSYGYVAWGIFTNSASAYYGNLFIQPYPFPSDNRLFWVKEFIRVTNLANSTDVPVIPAKWHPVIIYGACALGFMYLRKTDLANFWNQKYEQNIRDMISQHHLSEDDNAILKSVDSVARGTFIQMPGNYPVVGSR